jgi:hypothetical protein
MKIVSIFILTLVSFIGVSQHSRNSSIDSALVKNSDLIALVKVEEISDKIYFKLTMLFKDACLTDDMITVSQNDYTDNIDFDAEYLLFAKTDKDCHYYFGRESKLIKKMEGDEDTNFLLSILPCSDLKVKEKLKEKVGACHRNYSPVCGCDGRVYGNACEASRAGIQIFKKGECKR